MDGQHVASGTSLLKTSTQLLLTTFLAVCLTVAAVGCASWTFREREMDLTLHEAAWGGYRPAASYVLVRDALLIDRGPMLVPQDAIVQHGEIETSFVSSMLTATNSAPFSVPHSTQLVPKGTVIKCARVILWSNGVWSEIRVIGRFTCGHAREVEADINRMSISAGESSYGYMQWAPDPRYLQPVPPGLNGAGR